MTGPVDGDRTVSDHQLMKLGNDDLDVLAAEADAVRTARLRRALELTPGQRIELLAALLRQAEAVAATARPTR